MPKFNIGDTVIGNYESHYGITCKGWIGVVVSPEKYGYNTYGNNNLIVVENEEGGPYLVDEFYFDLYKAAVQVDTSEFLNLIFE